MTVFDLANTNFLEQGVNPMVENAMRQLFALPPLAPPEPRIETPPPEEPKMDGSRWKKIIGAVLSGIGTIGIVLGVKFGFF